MLDLSCLTHMKQLPQIITVYIHVMVQVPVHLKLGALQSLVTVFFNLPLLKVWMEESREPRSLPEVGGRGAAGAAAAGGGGAVGGGVAVKGEDSH